MIDKENTKVTMSLKDYEQLDFYKQAYEKLVRDIRTITYIDAMHSDSATVVIKKDEAEKLIVPFSARDCELDGIEDNIKIVWK